MGGTGGRVCVIGIGHPRKPFEVKVVVVGAVSPTVGSVGVRACAGLEVEVGG
jgi:hypothetical protein